MALRREIGDQGYFHDLTRLLGRHQHGTVKCHRLDEMDRLRLHVSWKHYAAVLKPAADRALGETSLVLAMILGPQLEASLRRSLIYSRGDLGVFFERPIAATLLTLALLMLLSPVFRCVPRLKLSQIMAV